MCQIFSNISCMLHKTQPYEQNAGRFVQMKSHKYFYLKYLIIILSVTSVKTLKVKLFQ